MKVIGIGDNVVDEYIHKKTYYPGGNAFNFSAYARMRGIDSAYLGVFGTDDPGKHVISVANDMGIDISRCKIQEGENGHAYVDLKNGDRVFVSSNRGGISREKPLILDEEDLKYVSQFDLAVTSINSHIFDELPKISELDIPLAFDFSIKKDIEILKNICPYIDFAISSCEDMEEDEIKIVIDKFHSYGAKYVLATRGAEGAVFSDNNKLYHSKAKLVKAIDTMGAGDSFLTTFLTNFIKLSNEIGEKDTEPLDYEEVIYDSLKQASEFAGEVCMIEGAFGYGKSL